MSESISVDEAIEGGYVAGIHTGKLEARLEIDEFVLDKDLLNMFLLGLIELQKKDYNDPWSWFQIAGIHGQPYSSWDNVGPKPSVENGATEESGYCSHSSVTFPTWHRPYLAMMEQAVYAEMLKIAGKFNNDTKRNYLNACSRFRFPYWDPSLPRHFLNRGSDISANSTGNRHQFGVPAIVSSPKVYLRKPNNPGVLVQEDNPLYQYNFPEPFHSPNNPDSFWSHNSGNILFDEPTLNGTLHTVRAPDQRGRTDDAYVNEYISNHIQSDIGSSMYKVLTLQKNWTAFSNDVLDNREASEAHESSMTLHHCNIDRITALWQAKRGIKTPDSWWKEEVARESTWAISRGTVQKPSDPLKPFRKSKGDLDGQPFWTSEKARDWSKLGYTYLGKRIVRNSSGQNELVTFPIDLNNNSSTDLNTFFNQFYGWMDISTPGYPALLQQFYPIDLSKVEALTGKAGPDRIPMTTSNPGISTSKPPDPTEIDYSHIRPDLRRNGTLRQWDIHMVAEKFKFNRSYQIFVFLGPFDTNNPDLWPVEENLVGINGIFSNSPISGGCSNCEQQADARLAISDVIPLTQHLLKWIRLGKTCPPDDLNGVCLENLDYEQVSRFLRKNFHWRVADMNLNPIENDLDCIKVFAADRLVALPKYYEEEVRFEEQTIHTTMGSTPATGDGGEYGETSVEDSGYRGSQDGGADHARRKGGEETIERYDGREEQEEEKKKRRKVCCGMPCILM